MSNVSNTLIELENFFQNLITQMLGLDPSLPENQDIVRIGWPEDGAPAWKRNEDKVFLKVTTNNSEYNKLKNITYKNKDSDSAFRNIEYTRGLLIQLTFYGPNSFDNAQSISNSFFIQSFKELYNSKNLFLNTSIDSPIRAPELFNGQWWDRSDLTVVFNEYLKIENTVPYIKSIEVILQDGINASIIND